MRRFVAAGLQSQERPTRVLWGGGAQHRGANRWEKGLLVCWSGLTGDGGTELWWGGVGGGGGRLAYGIGHLFSSPTYESASGKIPPPVARAASIECTHGRVSTSWLASMAKCVGAGADRETHRKRPCDRCKSKSPFLGFLGGGGLGGSTSSLLEGAFFVRLCQGFSVDVKLRGLPPRSA